MKPKILLLKSLSLWVFAATAASLTRRNIDFGICGGQRASKMALCSYTHIGFATRMVLRVLGGLCNTCDDHRLELEH